MKVLTIGRGDDCDIKLADDSGLISRCHAMIKCKGFGRYEIVDMSKNGTTVEGLRLSPDTPMPVKRGEVVIFAGTKQLDWSLIPDDLKIIKWAAICSAIIIITIAAIAFFGGSQKGSTPNYDNEDSSTETVIPKPKQDSQTPAKTEEESEVDVEKLRKKWMINEQPSKGSKAKKNNSDKAKDKADDKTSGKEETTESKKEQNDNSQKENIENKKSNKQIR